MLSRSLPFRQTLRQLTQLDISRAIGLGGLLIGIFALTLAFMLYSHETGYEEWLDHPDRVFRVEIDLTNLNGGGEDVILPTAPPALASAIQSTIPETKHITRLISAPITLRYAPPHGDLTVAAQFLDGNFLEIFPLPVISGSARDALTDPMSAIVTRDEALRVFGSADVAGRSIMLDNGMVLTIGAVLGDLPATTHFRFKGILLPIESPLSGFAGTGNDNWMASNTLTYLETLGRHSKTYLEREIAKVIARLSPLADSGEPGDPNYPRVRVVPVKQVHLHAEADRIAPDGMKSYGNKDLVNSFFYISIILIFICIFNMANIEISRMQNKKMLFFIHRVHGANYKNIFYKIFIELIIITFFVFTISAIFVYYSIPIIDKLLDFELTHFDIFNYNIAVYILFLNILIPMLISVIIIINYFKSSNTFNHIRFIKPNMIGQNFLNQILLFIQFGVIFFITITSVVQFAQHLHVLDYDRGFDPSQIFRIDLNTRDAVSVEILQQSLASQAGVYLTSSGVSVPREFEIATPIGLGRTKKFEDLKFNASEISVTQDFDKIFEMDMIAGRWFSGDRALDFYRRDSDSDAARSVVITRATVDKLGLGDPERAIGKIITFLDLASGLTPLRIIGVANNISFGDVNDKMHYFFIMPDDLKSKIFYVKSDKFLNEADLENYVLNNVQSFEDIGKMTVSRLDFNFNNMMIERANSLKILLLCTLLFMTVSISGLFSMLYRTFKKSFKEISVRRILGANVFQITIFITRRYIYNIAVASLIGSMAGYAWNRNILNGIINSIDINIIHFFITYLIVFLSCASMFLIIYIFISNVSVVKTLSVNE